MERRRARLEELLRGIVHEVRTEKLTFMAGSIAYHAFLSILPLLLLVFTLVQRIENVALSDSIVAIMQAVLTRQASDVIQQGIAEADASVSLLGLVFLVWGALRIFRGLDTAFSDIYETEHANTFTDQLGDGLVLLGTVTLAILAASLVGRIVVIDGTGALATMLRSAATVVGLFVVFYPMYYIFPDTDVTPLEVVPGTAFAAVGLTVAQVLFTTFKSGGSGSNLVASILLLLTWLYVIGFVILLGVAINAVLSNRSQDVDVAPVIGGVETRSSDRRASVRRDDLLADLDHLVETLPGADQQVTVVLDGDRVTLQRPQTASVDRSSRVFGMDDSVALTLRWWPDE
jgi:membrane protein